MFILFNTILESVRIPEEWRRSALIQIFKNRVDVATCSKLQKDKADESYQEDMRKNC